MTCGTCPVDWVPKPHTGRPPALCAWNDHIWGYDLRVVLDTPGQHQCQTCGMKVTVL